MFSTSLGHGDVLLWFFEIFLFVVWFWLLMNIFGDLFRDHELPGVNKAVWVVALVVFPYVGILAYLILRGGGMGARAAKSARDAQERFDSYVRSVSGATPSAPEQIEKAKALLDAGTIDRSEYDRLKAKALQ